MLKIFEKITKASTKYQVYAVGGFVRDLLTKQDCIDIDLAVNKNALKYSKDIAKIFNAKVITLDDKNKIYRLVAGDFKPFKNIDISLFDGKTIEEDLIKRDFTINAIAFNICDYKNFKDNLIYVDTALNDLKNKVLNPVSKEIFKQDALRMLRAFRLSSVKGYKISDKLFRLIKQDKKNISKSASERIIAEIFMILSQKNSFDTFCEMDKSGLLCEVFSEIKNMKRASKKHYYHSGGLFEHSFETFKACENILNNLKKHFPKYIKELQEHFFASGEFSLNITRANLVKFASLFHDGGKPQTAKREGKKMRFFGHELEGAKKISQMMKSLKMGKKDISQVSFLIENHMRPSTLTKNNFVTKKATLKFIRDVKDNTPDLLILAMADWYSYKKLKIFVPSELKMQEKSVKKIIENYYELKNAKPLKKIIDGNIIMKEFDLKPGPWIGDLIDIVKQAQDLQRISTANEAVEVAGKNLKKVMNRYKKKL